MFQTSIMLVPMAVSASTRWSRSIGTEKTLTAKAKAANKPPIAVPNEHHPSRCGTQEHADDMIETREGRDAEEKRVEQHRRAHPQQHEQAKQQASEETCAPARGRTRKHRAEGDLPAFLDRAALLVEADCQERRDDHEPGKRRKQDVVAPGGGERPRKSDRQEEDHDPYARLEPGWSRNPASLPKANAILRGAAADGRDAGPAFPRCQKFR